ncbi:MAG TPA: hypothetical protein PK961_15290, partial [bacterium]|nr:hypothetical protein [bacterium]
GGAPPGSWLLSPSALLEFFPWNSLLEDGTMKSIVALAFLLTLCLLPAACGDDNSVTGDSDDGTPVTCEELCTFISDCYPDTGPTAYTVDECMSKCDEDNLQNDIWAQCYNLDKSSCDSVFDCVDNS